MRVLFCSTGGQGHVRPMLPLARAFLRQGHHLAWATSPDALAGLAALGIDGIPVGPDMAVARHDYRQAWPEATWLQGEALSAHTFPRLFGAVIAPRMLAGLRAAVDQWHPDLVVNEASALAAPLVCATRGLPHVTHGYGLRPAADHLKAAMTYLVAHWAAAGLEPPPDAGLYRHLYLDIVPPRLTPAGTVVDGGTRLLHPLDAQAGTADADTERALRAFLALPRPRVYLTFGTVFNRDSGPLHQAVAALARLGLSTLVTLGRDGDRSALGPLPPQVLAEHHVDQQRLLPACDAVVSHGGAGPMLGAAAHGLPHLMLPQGADHFRNAAALMGTGAGWVLRPEACSVEAVGAAVWRLLTNPAHARAAQGLARSADAMPGADRVAAWLVQWLGAPVHRTLAPCLAPDRPDDPAAA